MTLGKLVHDVAVFAALRPGQRTPWTVVPAVLLKDLLLFVTWAYGLFARSVDWRGTRLRVRAGSRLVPTASSQDTSSVLPPPEGRGHVLVS